MRTFQIKELTNCEEYKYIVFSTSYINPFDDRDQIEKLLKEIYSGKVVFDLLLKNGISDNRFVEVIFDGEKFDLNTTKIIKNIDLCIRKFASKYYMQHEELLNNSVLPNAYRFLIKNGRIF